jgi:hypothetical protein
MVDDDSPQRRKTLLSRVTSFGKSPSPEHETSRPVTFIDGGFGEANNPSKEAFYEVTTNNEQIGTFVSIGTGRGKVDKFHKGLRRLVPAAFAAVGDPDPAHAALQKESQNVQSKFGYYRLDEPNGLGDLEFDEWKPRKNGNRTRKRIEDAFRAWAIDPKVSENLQRCALELVRRRRLRTADESEWERYAVEAFFDCEEGNCQQPGDKRWYKRSDFQHHLLTDHGIADEHKLQEKAQICRKMWRYKPPSNGGTN